MIRKININRGAGTLSLPDLRLGADMKPWDFDTNRERYDELWGIDIMNSNHVLNGG